jgi:NADPH:quinone reductase
MVRFILKESRVEPRAFPRDVQQFTRASVPLTPALLGVIRPYGRVASSVGVRGDLDRLLDLNLTLHGILVRPDQRRLEAVNRLVSSGAFRPIIDQVLPLEEAAQAHRRLESGHGQGKIVLVVRE